jgi:hypothetical protein
MADQQRVLELFLIKVEELSNCSLVKSGQRVKFSIKFKKEEGGTIQTSLPDEDSLRSFLMVFRNFYAQKEITNFNKVCKLLIDSLEDNSIKELVKNTRAVYQEILKMSPINLVKNGKSYSPEEIVNFWLYGFYLHTEDEKRKEIENWNIGIGFTKTQFISTIFDLSNCIFWLGNVVKKFVDGKIK